MSKKNLKSLVVGVIIGGMLTTGVGYASSHLTSLEVSLNPVTFLYNGNQIELEEQTFIVDGTTYVPVRWISETLGKKVEWDEEKRAISIYDDTVIDSEDSLSEKVSFTLDQTEYSANDTVRMSITNNSDQPISFGRPFNVEYLSEGRWLNWPMDDIAFTMELIILNTDENFEQEIELSQLGIKEGTYRITKSITMEGEKPFEIYSEFTVK